jgi:hypothetical protein
MGDGLSGTADAFNRISNRVYSDNNYTYLRAISGSLTQDVIKTVSINGLTGGVAHHQYVVPLLVLK